MTTYDIIRMAKEAGLPTIEDTGEILGINSAIRFANLVAAAEREACAKLCESADDDEFYFGRNYAEAIRARGQE